MIEPLSKFSISRILFQVTTSVQKGFQISLIHFLPHNLEHHVNHTLPLEREDRFKTMIYIYCIFQSKMFLGGPFSNPAA